MYKQTILDLENEFRVLQKEIDMDDSPLFTDETIHKILRQGEIEKEIKLLKRPLHTCRVQPSEMPYYGGLSFYDYMRQNMHILTDTLNELNELGEVTILER